jgi:hypothetical protein
MNKIKTATNGVKKFVRRHRVGIAVIGTSAFWITVNRADTAAHNNFLAEKGLTDEFLESLSK